MVCGVSRAALPAVGRVGARGVLRTVSWPTGGGEFGFVAAIRTPPATEPENGAIATLLGAGRVDLRLPAEASPPGAFGQALARMVGAHAAAALRFMLETLRPPTDGRGREALAGASVMLRAFLSKAAQEDGCIEIMLAVPGGCVALQGWGAPLSGTVRLLLAGPAITAYPAQAGSFARTDVSAPATGVMLSLPPAAEHDLAATDHVYILTERGLHSRTLVEHRILDAAASIGHIRHMLPALCCTPTMADALQGSVRPRFDGRDTLEGHALPVRAALDCALSAAGAGAYVSGWMFDPAALVTSVHLCGDAGFSSRLDDLWTRIPRPDVCEAYRNLTAFPTPPDADADVGFAVATRTAPAPGEVLHLRFTFRDNDHAFMPVTPADPADPAVRARLLAGVDLFKPSGLPVIEDQVAPLLSRVRTPALGTVRVALRGPLARPDAIVVALPTPRPPRALLSGLLHDPASPDEQLILVCGPEWSHTALERLRAQVEFYALPASILRTETTASAVTALAAAAQASGAATLLLAGAGISAAAPGWRKALRSALGKAAFACPTLLYEDWSFRFAGSIVPVLNDAPPYVQMNATMAGLPASGMDARVVTAASAGTLECCLIARAALNVPHLAGAFSTAMGQEAAFFLGLQAAGLAGVWVPYVQIYAPEEHTEASGLGAARLVDGWMLRAGFRTSSQTGQGNA